MCACGCAPLKTDVPLSYHNFFTQIWQIQQWTQKCWRAHIHTKCETPDAYKCMLTLAIGCLSINSKHTHILSCMYNTKAKNNINNINNHFPGFETNLFHWWHWCYQTVLLMAPARFGRRYRSWPDLCPFIASVIQSISLRFYLTT